MGCGGSKKTNKPSAPPMSDPNAGIVAPKQKKNEGAPGEPEEEKGPGKRNPDHIFTITLKTRPFGVILTSNVDGICAYVTSTNPESNSAVETLPLKSKLLKVNDTEVELDDFASITSLIIEKSKELPLVLTFCHPDGLAAGEEADPDPLSA